MIQLDEHVFSDGVESPTIIFCWVFTLFQEQLQKGGFW